MMPQDSKIAETARLWAIRVGDPAFDDWTGFTTWLEADPLHLAAYEAALEASGWAEHVLAQEPHAANEDEIPEMPPRSGRHWWGLGGAIAACLALIGAWFVLNPLAGERTIVVPPGEHRTVALADGSRMILNSGTKVSIERNSQRHVKLARGEALFEIHHNASDPFVVTIGKTRLIDVGTTFNVVGDDGALEVRVAQGAVVYRQGPRNIRLDAGNGLTRASADAEPVLIKIAPGTVGDWQDGLLEYQNAPLDRVARDLGRNLGVQIVAADGAERMSFTGTLVINGTQAEVFERAGALMGVRFKKQGDEWRMTPARDAHR